MGSFHYGLVHKPISIQEAMETPEAKAAVDEEWETLTRLLACGEKMKSSQRRTSPVKRKKKEKSHFANLMDLGHLKNPRAAEAAM